MNIKTRVYGVREKNKFARRGYIYCWYYEVYDDDSGNVLASDNTGNWHIMLDAAMKDTAAIRHCASLGILKKSRGW